MGEGTRVDMRVGAFDFGVDEPVSVGGTGTAPNPVQLALAALGSCQAITYRYWAEELGLRLDAVTATVRSGPCRPLQRRSAARSVSSADRMPRLPC